MYTGYNPTQTHYGQNLLNLLAQAHRALEMTAAITNQLLLTPNTAKLPGLRELHDLLPTLSHPLDIAMGAARLSATGYHTPLVHGMIVRSLAQLSEQQVRLDRTLETLQKAERVAEVISAAAAWAQLLPTAVRQATDLVRAAVGQEQWQRFLNGDAFREMAGAEPGSDDAAEALDQGGPDGLSPTPEA